MCLLKSFGLRVCRAWYSEFNICLSLSFRCVGFRSLRVFLESQLPIITTNFPLISYYFWLK